MAEDGWPGRSPAELACPGAAPTLIYEESSPPPGPWPHFSRWPATHGGGGGGGGCSLAPVLPPAPESPSALLVPCLRAGPRGPVGLPSHPHRVAAVSSSAKMTLHLQLYQSFHRWSESRCKMWSQAAAPCVLVRGRPGRARPGWGLGPATL